VDDPGAEQRDLFRRWPTGVSVVVAEADGRRAGLTVNTLVSLSLEPPLIGISLAVVASLFEVLSEAGEWFVSILAADQDHLAQHFARNVPPIALWDGIAVRDDNPLLLQGAVGWISARTVQEMEAGDHRLFIGEIKRLERGPGKGSLVYLDRRYVPL
jgi:flavin reductase (DIM6/NTAB) family NADH-FMN oxidoreductase RutF